MYHRSPTEVAHLVIAGEGTEVGMRRSGWGGPRRSKDARDLQFTRADADAILQHIRETVHDAGSDRSHAQLLVAPTTGEFLAAVQAAINWVAAVRNRPDWNGGGIHISFSGHGEPDDGALVLRDGVITPTALARLLAELAAGLSQRFGVELFLDSCFSGAFLIEFLACYNRGVLIPRDMFAATLDDELAWEMDNLGHGALTFAVVHPGNAHADLKRLAKAVNDRDRGYIAQALCGMVPNPVTFLTDGDQHSIDLLNGHHLQVKGAGWFEVPFERFARRDISQALGRARMASHGDGCKF